MANKKSAPPPPDPQIAIRAQQEAQAKADAQAAADLASKKAAEEQAAKLKAIQGNESAADIAAREATTMAKPVKQKMRGRRSLVTGSALGTGVSVSKDTLG